jgi:hypothetical protein
MTTQPPSPRLDPDKVRKLLALIADVRTQAELAQNR